MVWYRVGAADETPGKSGLAHFLEHLLFKGTKKNPQGLFSQTVATIGGSENAFTSSDYTGYFQRTSRDRLKLMMEFESDRMTSLVLTDDVVKPELQVVLEERNSRVENNVNARLVRADGSGALSEPSLWPAGDRLAQRDRRAHARRRAGVLQALLHAQQRDPHRRRRRLAGRSEDACRGNLRPCSARRRGETAPPSAGAEAGSAAHRHPRRSARHPAEPAAATISRPPTPPAVPARPKRSTFSPTSWAAAPTAASIRSWWWTPASRSAPAPATTAPRST